MIRLQTKTVRQGIYKAYLKEPVERLEFYNFKNDLSNLLNLNQILPAKKENPEAYTSELEAEIGPLEYDLYGLSEEEIGVVEGSVDSNK